MATFCQVAAQGELYIRKVTELPKGCKNLKVEGGLYIVGHSETGHHHVIREGGCDVLEHPKAPEGMRILYAIVKDPGVQIEHLRPTDTHEPVALQEGMYEIRTGREYDPFSEVIRRQAD